MPLLPLLEYYAKLGPKIDIRPALSVPPAPSRGEIFVEATHNQLSPKLRTERHIRHPFNEGLEEERARANAPASWTAAALCRFPAALMVQGRARHSVRAASGGKTLFLAFDLWKHFSCVYFQHAIRLSL